MKFIGNVVVYVADVERIEELGAAAQDVPPYNLQPAPMIPWVVRNMKKLVQNWIQKARRDFLCINPLKLGLTSWSTDHRKIDG